MSKAKYYAVIKGRKTGIFTSWSQCEQQVKGFSGAIFKSFGTRAEAEAAIASAGQNGNQSPQSASRWESTSRQRSTSTFIETSICVDAACSGNPGVVEYQGVCTTTHEVLFHMGPIPHGTNNLGEFLAIVHALAYLKQTGKDIPIYSDSETAMLWVRNKRVKTTLVQNANSEEIFNLIERALSWLKTNEYTNSILKWDTKAWGEIPADFGRK
ncbi:MAG: viroplasmin family protein [Leptolyngbyaceae cyanobacterium bins.349]|nr:viroplasmin family protein [Leptolyngbyaceae cyanobacterium bins.349]